MRLNHCIDFLIDVDLFQFISKKRYVKDRKKQKTNIKSIFNFLLFFVSPKAQDIGFETVRLNIQHTDSLTVCMCVERGYFYRL